MSEVRDETPAAPAGSGAGRGALYLAGSNIHFMIAGLAITFGLPRFVSPEQYGAWQFANQWTSLFNTVLIGATLSTVSKFIAADPATGRAVQSAALRLQMRIGVVIAALFVAAAPVIAWLSRDWSIAPPLMLAGAIIGGNAFYAVFVGTANGFHQFGKQAALSLISQTVRAILLLGVAYLGLGLLGLIGAWTAVVALILAVSVAWVGVPDAAARANPAPLAPMVKFFVPVAVFTALFTALTFADTFLLKPLLTNHYVHAGMTDIAAAAEADKQLGYYGAVQNLARLSYQLVLAAAFVVFPLVSRSTSTADREATRGYVEITSRYSFIVAAAIAVVMAANPAGVLGVPYTAEYVANGAASLPILALGTVAFAMISIAGYILNAAGHTRDTILIAGATLALAVAGNLIAIPIAAEGAHVLEVTAAVTSAAMLLGSFACAFALRRRFGGFIPLVTLARVVVAAAATIAVGHVLPFTGKLMAIVGAALSAVIYLVVLAVTRELTATDLKRVLTTRRARKQGAST